MKLRNIQANHLTNMRCNREVGFTRRELLVIIAALVVLTAILLPHLIKLRARGSRVSCSNNVRYIGTVFHRWAMDHNGKYPMQVPAKDGGTRELIERGKVLEHFLVLSNELKSPYCLVCPEDKERWKHYEKLKIEKKIIAGITNLFPTSFPISYFVGVDADEGYPKMLLTGDDNFAVDGRKPKPGLLSLWTNSQVAWTGDRHSNVVSTGGHVEFVGGLDVLTTRRLQDALIQTGVATNRLAMPLP